MLGDHGAFLLPPTHLKNAIPVFAASHDNQEQQAIMDELAAAPQTPLLILYDGDNQHTKHETLPPLAPWDRAKLIERRLDAAFGDHALRGTLTNPDKSVTLLAIKEAKPLAALLDRLATRPVLSGFVSLSAIECLLMIPRLAPKAAKGWACLLTTNRTSGPRAVITCDGRLIYSRLLSPLSKSAAQTAKAIMSEIKALHDYLARFGLTAETPLTLIALLPSPLHEALNDI
ncbi:MAG TPA: hypothetical protein DCY07_01560, partial [Rhodospirillaceae bacterium]|nr:hypothetical protein [Rhodospirillaceae bacterium]